MALTPKQSNILILISIGVIVALLYLPTKTRTHLVTPTSDCVTSDAGVESCPLPPSMSKELEQHQ